MKRLLFIRHGESEANARGLISSDRNGYHLVEEGRKQIEYLTGQIYKLRFRSAYSSPLLRCVESAHLISGSLGIPISIDERLRETDYGDLNNSVIHGRLIDLDPDFLRANRVESLESHLERTESFIKDSADMSIVVTHGLVVRAAISIVTGIGQDEMGGVRIRPGSMTFMDTDSRKLYSLGNFQITDAIRKAFSVD